MLNLRQTNQINNTKELRSKRIIASRYGMIAIKKKQRIAIAQRIQQLRKKLH